MLRCIALVDLQNKMLFVQMWMSVVTSRATPKPCAPTLRDLSIASANPDFTEMVSSAFLRTVLPNLMLVH